MNESDIMRMIVWDGGDRRITLDEFTRDLERLADVLDKIKHMSEHQHINAISTTLHGAQGFYVQWRYRYHTNFYADLLVVHTLRVFCRIDDTHDRHHQHHRITLDIHHVRVGSNGAPTHTVLLYHALDDVAYFETSYIWMRFRDDTPRCVFIDSGRGYEALMH